MGDIELAAMKKHASQGGEFLGMRTKDRVRAYAAENPSATVREIQKALKISSPSVVQFHLKTDAMCDTVKMLRAALAERHNGGSMDLRISDISSETGLSKRYWQRLAMSGDLPGAHYVQFGERRTYLVDADTFRAWWQKQKKEIPCRATSEKGAKFGGTGSPKTALRTKVRLQRTTSASLKSAFKEFAKS